MPRKNDHPNFFRIFYEEAQPLRDALTQGQCQKLLGAMAMYFLFREEPYGLPRQARALFESHRARLDRYRNSAINGGKNSQDSNAKHNPKSESKTASGFHTLSSRVPAEHQELGGYPERDPSGLVGVGVGYPQKETVKSKEGKRGEDAPASYPILPPPPPQTPPKVSYEEYREAAVRLEATVDDGMDPTNALTAEEIVTYKAGYPLYQGRYAEERAERKGV